PSAAAPSRRSSSSKSASAPATPIPVTCRSTSSARMACKASWPTRASASTIRSARVRRPSTAVLTTAGASAASATSTSRPQATGPCASPTSRQATPGYSRAGRCASGGADMLRILLLAAVLPALPAHADQATIAKPVTQLAKPATDAGAAAPTDATHYWYDGGRRRGLLVDDDLRADFGSGKAIPADRQARGGKALDAPTGPEAADGSPVFRDADSPAIKRALP